MPIAARIASEPRRRAVLSSRRALAAILAATLAWAAIPAAPAGAAPGPHLTVHVLDVGQGSCVLVECPDDLPIIVDCGKKTWPASPPPPGPTLEIAGQKIEAILAPYRAPGVRPLRVVVSHPDEDHFALLPGGVRPADVGAFYYGGKVAHFPTRMRTWIDDVSRGLTGQPYLEGPCAVAAVSCFRANESGFPSPRLSCGAARLDLLTSNAFAYYTRHPSSAREGLKSDRNKNPDSAIVRVSYRGTSFILTGDAQEVSQVFAVKNATAAGESLAGTSFLMASHHGANTHDSNDTEWIAATQPAAVIFSGHTDAGYGHPPCAVTDRFDRARYPNGGQMAILQSPVLVRCGYPGTSPKTYSHQFLATQSNGDITIVVDDTGATVRCARENEAC